MTFEIIRRLLMSSLYIVMLILTRKEQKRLDKDRPISHLISHLLDVELWIAALLVLIAIG